MPAVIKQIVTIQPGGVIQFCSPDLHEGDQAEVTVVVTQKTSREKEIAGLDSLRHFAGMISSNHPRAGDNAKIDADLAKEYGR